LASTSPLCRHCILELHGCAAGLLDDERYIREALSQAAVRSLSTLLRLCSHRFEPHGVTAIALLAESHISIHTWPENGYAAVDIFTCGETARPEEACAYIVDRFGAARHDLVVLPRGEGALDAADSPREAALCRAPS